MVTLVSAVIPEDDEVSIHDGLCLLRNMGTHTVYRPVVKILSHEIPEFLAKTLRNTKPRTLLRR